MKNLFTKFGGYLASRSYISPRLKNLIIWPVGSRILGLKYNQIISMKDGFQMIGSMQDILSREILFIGRFKSRLWEPSTSALLEKLSRESKEIFIAGAHMGYLVLLAAHHTKGRVHGFEPIPELFKRTQENIALNLDLKHKVTLTQAALGEKEGEIIMYSEDIRSSVIPYSGGHVAHQNKVTVPITTIDSYMKKERVIKADLILLDIEGFEWFALNGSEAALQHRPTLILEVSPRVLSHTNITPQILIERILNMGYEIKFIDDYSNDAKTVEYSPESAAMFLKRDYVNILATA